MQEFILYGNGGHARVLKDLIQCLGGEVVCIFDSENPYNASLFPNAKLIIAIGNTILREKISKEIKHDFGILVHPNVVLANDVKVEEGTVILANAVVQSGAIVGKHCIINAGVVVDHDVIIEDFVNIYPNSYIGGETRITKHQTIDAITVVPRLTIL